MKNIKKFFKNDDILNNNNLKFIERCVLNLETTKNIDDYIKKWHIDKNLNESLYKFLGMTLNEYENYLQDSYYINDIIEDRKNRIEILKEETKNKTNFIFLDSISEKDCMKIELEIIMNHNNNVIKKRNKL